MTADSMRSQNWATRMKTVITVFRVGYLRKFVLLSSGESQMRKAVRLLVRLKEPEHNLNLKRTKRNKRKKRTRVISPSQGR